MGPRLRYQSRSASRRFALNKALLSMFIVAAVLAVASLYRFGTDTNALFEYAFNEIPRLPFFVNIVFAVGAVGFPVALVYLLVYYLQLKDIVGPTLPESFHIFERFVIASLVIGSLFAAIAMGWSGFTFSQLYRD